MGMAHRGRLNVLANIIGKRPAGNLSRVRGRRPRAARGPRRREVPPGLLSNYFTTANGREVHMSLCFNPSHLEFVNTGCHGADAGEAGPHSAISERTAGHGAADPRRRGLRRRGSRAGNAQPERTARLHRGRHDPRHREQPDRVHHPAARRPVVQSTATDVAKMLQIPIFHVNGEDPEAVAQVRRAGDGFPPRRSNATW